MGTQRPEPFQPARKRVAQGVTGYGVMALGGGIYSSGVLTIASSIIQNNQAVGGNGIDGTVQPGNGGLGAGGGIYIKGGIVTLSNTTISSNLARGGNGAGGLTADGVARGGGIYVYSGSVSIDSFTLAHTSGNSASTSDNDIFGSFTVLA